VAISEAARSDLYHGLADVLGADRAETLMSVLPSYELTDIATKGDIAMLSARIDGLEISLGTRMDRLESRMGGLESRMDGLESRMDGLESRMDRLESRMDGLESRMDRFFIALVTGMFLIIATIIGGFFTL
jgi:uncharacterized coiled-coil protein SlyX